MGNRVYIEVVEQTPRGGGESTEIVKVFDDYNTSEIVVWEGKAPTDDKELLFYVLTHADDNAKETIDFALENEKPLHINDTFFEHEEWSPWAKEHDDLKKILG